MDVEEELLNSFTLLVIPAFSKRSVQVSKVFDPKEQIGETQEWKEDSRVLNILEETILKFKNVQRIQHLLIPPILTLIQDHQVHYKIMGINLLVALRKKSYDLRGLEELFRSELFNCLTWHSHPELIRLSLQVLIDITDSIELENVLQQVLQGLVYSLGMNDVVQVEFLNALTRLIPDLGIKTVQFTKSLIITISDILLIATELKTIKSALITMGMVIDTCWIRIPNLKGVILASVAESWLRVESDQLLCFYQNVVKCLQNCCDLTDDLSLLSFNKSFDRLIDPLHSS